MYLCGSRSYLKFYRIYICGFNEFLGGIKIFLIDYVVILFNWDFVVYFVV